MPRMETGPTVQVGSDVPIQTCFVGAPLAGVRISKHRVGMRNLHRLVHFFGHVVEKPDLCFAVQSFCSEQRFRIWTHLGPVLHHLPRSVQVCR